MSMKPGDTTAPLASSSRSPPRFGPISAMWPSSITTSARRPGAPVPSTTLPPRIANRVMSHPSRDVHTTVTVDAPRGKLDASVPRRASRRPTSPGIATVRAVAVNAVDVDVDRARGVTVTFDDGAVCRYELVDLRRNCPCATCRNLRDHGEEAWPRPGSPQPLAV